MAVARRGGIHPRVEDRQSPRRWTDLDYGLSWFCTAVALKFFLYSSLIFLLILLMELQQPRC